MKIDKLFQVVVVMGASATVGLEACSSSTPSSGGDGGGSSGEAAEGGGSGSSTGSGTSGSAADSSAGSGSSEAGSCNCMPEKMVTTWIDCNGCCCWLPAGSTVPASLTPICGNEPCCTGNGR